MLRPIAAIIVSLLITSAAPATWLDFTGWDDSLVSNGGQRFEDIFGSIDLLVRRTGTADASSSAILDHISVAGNSDSQTYAFNFSEPLDLKVEIHTLDPLERVTINSSNANNPIRYDHLFGQRPTITGSTLQGSAFGLSANGVSNGIVQLGNTRSFLMSYEALSDSKFEAFSIGTNAVPEPNPAGLLALGVVVLMGFRSRKD